MPQAAAVGAAGVIVHGGHVTDGGDLAEGFVRWRKALEQLESEVPVLLENTAGGNHAKVKNSATGIAAPYMNGCRRPQRDRVTSDQRPISGSATASTTNVAAIAIDTTDAGMPTT